MNKKALKTLAELKINYYDLQILAFCFHKPHSVAELVEVTGMAHKNLLPHLKTLEKAELIDIKDNGRGRRKEVTTAQSWRALYFIFGLQALWTSEKDLAKEKELNKAIANYLRKVAKFKED